MEDGVLTISRSKEQVTYPCRFVLVASANPCPCGYLEHPKKPCGCTPREIERYRKKISGPILDRIDLHLDIPIVDIEELSKNYDLSRHAVASDKMREKVLRARFIQEERFKDDTICVNSEMKNKQITRYCKLSREVKDILLRGARVFNLSARSYFKMIKVARTIADLEGRSDISAADAAEALQYRPKLKGES
jgi:magnesium chelatase family protein